MTSAKRIALLLVLFFSSAIAIAQKSPSSEADLKKQADKLFEKQNYEEATPMFSQLLSLYPREAIYNYRYGLCLLLSGHDKTGAATFLEVAAKSKETDADVFFYLGRSYMFMDHYNEAIAEFTLFKKNASTDRKSVLQPDIFIKNCENADQLRRDRKNVVILNKRKVSRSSFFASYDFSEAAGKLLTTPDRFLTPLDKEKMPNPVMFMTKDGETIYYASYGKKGEHGKDIYRLIKLPDGSWSLPVNLSSAINTDANEDFPYLDKDGRTLYFSSNGLNSIGGYDIFKSQYDFNTGKWSDPVNVGVPINTVDDDIFFMPSTKGLTAVYSTAVACETGKIEIRNIKLGDAVSNVAVISGKYFSQDQITRRDARITVVRTKDNGVVTSVKTDRTGEYELVLPAGDEYMLIVEGGSYVPHAEVFSVPANASFSGLKQRVSMNKMRDTEEMTMTNYFSPSASDSSLVIMEKPTLVARSAFDIKDTANSKMESITFEGKTLFVAPPSLKNPDAKTIEPLSYANEQHENTREKQIDTNIEKAEDLKSGIENETINEPAGEVNNTNAEAKNEVGGIEGKKTETVISDKTSNTELVRMAFEDAQAMKEEASDLRESAVEKRAESKSLDSIAGSQLKQANALLAAGDKEKSLEIFNESHENALEAQQKNNDADSIEAESRARKVESETSFAEASQLMKDFKVDTNAIAYHSAGIKEAKNNSTHNAGSKKSTGLSNAKGPLDKQSGAGISHGEKARKLYDEADKLIWASSDMNRQANSTKDKTRKTYFEKKSKDLAKQSNIRRAEADKENALSVQANEQPIAINNEGKKNPSTELSITDETVNSPSAQNDKTENISQAGPGKMDVTAAGGNLTKAQDNQINGEKNDEVPAVTPSVKQNEKNADAEIKKDAGNEIVGSGNAVANDNSMKENVRDVYTPANGNSKKDSLNTVQPVFAENSGSIAKEKVNQENDNNVGNIRGSKTNDAANDNSVKDSNLKSGTQNDTKVDAAADINSNETSTQNLQTPAGKKNSVEVAETKPAAKNENIALESSRDKSVDNSSIDSKAEVAKENSPMSPSEELKAKPIQRVAADPIALEHYLNYQQSINESKKTEAISKETEAKLFSPNSKEKRDSLEAKTAQLNKQSIIEWQSAQKELTLAKEIDPLIEEKVAFDKPEASINETKIKKGNTGVTSATNAGIEKINIKDSDEPANAVHENNDSDNAESAVVLDTTKPEYPKYIETQKAIVQKQTETVNFFVEGMQLNKKVVAIKADEMKLRDSAEVTINKKVKSRLVEKADSLAMEADIISGHSKEMLSIAQKNTGTVKELTAKSDQLKASLIITPASPGLADNSAEKNDRMEQTGSKSGMQNSAPQGSESGNPSAENKSAVTLPATNNQTSGSTAESATQKEIVQSKPSAPETPLTQDKNTTSTKQEQESQSANAPVKLPIYPSTIPGGNAQTTQESTGSGMPSEKATDALKAPTIIPAMEISDASTFSFGKGDAYSAANPIPIDPILPEGLIFKVQIGAFHKPLPDNTFNNLQPLSGETTRPGWIRYCLGLFRTFEPANLLKKEVRGMGYKDAFVVAYYNGKRIPLYDAYAMISKANNQAKQTYSSVSEKECNQLAKFEIKSSNHSTGPDEDAKAFYGTTEKISSELVEYAVQVGVYKSSHVPSVLGALLPINTEQMKSGLFRFTTGRFDNRAAADSMKRIAISAGVKDAFVVIYKGGMKAGTEEIKKIQAEAKNISKPLITAAKSTSISKENTGESGTASQDEVVFKVQIGAFKENVPLSTVSSFLSIADKGISRETDSRGLNIFYAGQYKDYKIAAATKDEIVLKGLKDAFIVAFVNGKRTSAGEALKHLNGK